MYFPFLFHNEEKPDLFLGLFSKISQKELKTKNIELYSQINTATTKIASYFENSVEIFPTLFENNLESFEACLTYLEKIAIPNKCVCAGVIDNIPGWKCSECSKFENTVYCKDCFENSRELHKDHKVAYLPASIGMCDCGDPLSLHNYCKVHSGPFTEQKQIDDYIQKSFGDKVLENLKNFFDDFFLEYSKYFILNEKCELFFDNLYYEKFAGILDENIINEKEDVKLLKSNFCIVFQNFIYFLRLITKNNSGMVHLISNYFLKSNFGSTKLEEEYYTEHRCIEVSQNDIKILFDNENKQKHICKCPFLSIFLSNYRNKVSLDSKEDEQQFLFSFAQNLQLRSIFAILYFFNHKSIIYNNNENLIYCRTQFYLENSLEFISTKTSFLEDSVDNYYNYFLNLLKENESKNQNEQSLQNIYRPLAEFCSDFKYYSKTQMRLVMTEKSLFFKKVINLLSLFHNYDKLKSIVPHVLQEKKFDSYVFDSESILMIIPRLLIYCLDWKNIEKLKDIYKHLIYKILNQEKEGIKQLSENEFTFNLDLYRIFGTFMNAFCFNYSFINNCTIVDSIKFFKTAFFDSQEQIENFVDLILKDYFKFFGFIFGTNNNFFNYYSNARAYFKIYNEFNFYKNDFNTLKYLFALTEKKININSYLKISNLENVYTKFDNIFNLNKIEEDKPIPEPEVKKPEEVNENFSNIVQGLLNLIPLNNQMNIKSDKSHDETNIIRQWENLFDMLILIAKDDSCCYWSLIDNLEEILSIETKNDLSNIILNNKYAMEDLKNILKEKIIIAIISQGNSIDSKNLEKKINGNLLNLFDENNIFNQILDELTYNKTNGENKIYYLKDEYLKHIDYNNYVQLSEKTQGQKYILDFKKNIVNIYNYYFYNDSELTFDFFEIVFEKIFLSKDNFELIAKIFEKLLNEDKITEHLSKKSIRNSLLPTILNYLQIFNVINTKSFIEFKLENKNSINKLYELLLDFVKNNEKNNFIDKDLEDNMKEVINQMNRYQLIYDNFGGDLSKLNKYDFNTNILEQLKQSQQSNTNSINIIPENKNKHNEEEEKIKQKKEKLKLLMRKKSNNFMKKIESNEDLVKAIDEHINDVENMNNKDDEIMCFYCRNSINLKSFEKPYGKLGLSKLDYFYTNSIKAAIREEMSNLGIKDENNSIYNEICSKIFTKILKRVNSCGHYFHNSCFIEGKEKNENEVFTCPLCLKDRNTLIPPLAILHDKYNILKSEKLSFLLKKEEEKKENEEIKNENIFDDIVRTYLTKNDFFKDDIEKYEAFIEYIYPDYKAFFNYFENIFYSDGTTFHKQQQIDNMKNLILSFRVIINNSKDIKKDEITKYIIENLLNIAKGPGENIFLYQYSDSYLHYINLFEKILLSLQILFDYDEMKETFKYLLYIFLPYFCFGFYYRKLIIENKNNKITKEKLKEKLDLNEFKKYLEEDNKQIMQYFTSFIKTFCFTKLISDYKNKNEDIINCINELSTKKILSIIDMNEIAQNLPENEIKINDIINNLFKAINEKDILYQLFSPLLNFDKVLNSILENAKKCNIDENYEITHELLIQFCPIKFNFIKLDDNVFDFLLKYLDKKCVICNQTKRESLICLICGKRVCDPLEYNNYEALDHADYCTADYCYFIHINELILYNMSNERLKKMYSLYVDKNGSGLKKKEITNEFSLSHEKLKLALKEYVSKEFYFMK